MLQKDHDVGLPGYVISRIEFYNSEAILLIRNPFQSLIQTRIYNGISAGPDVQKDLFIENEGNQQTINSFSIISSQLSLIDFT